LFCFLDLPEAPIGNMHEIVEVDRILNGKDPREILDILHYLRIVHAEDFKQLSRSAGGGIRTHEGLRHGMTHPRFGLVLSVARVVRTRPAHLARNL